MARRRIDFCVGWGGWPEEPFADMVRRHCRAHGLSCAFCQDNNVPAMIREVEKGTTRIAFHLDLYADYEESGDRYAKLAYAVKDSGGLVVNEPDHARLAANKAVLHYRFEKAGIPVPYTVVVRNSEPADFTLTATERRKLGRPFIIKPARGYGKQGVAKADNGSVDEIGRARRYDKGDAFLLQQWVEPRWFGHHMAWFRVFYVVGEIIICWWDKVTEHYACTTIEEFDRCNLMPLCKIMGKIARTAGMNFFTTELAITGNGSHQRCFAIDYVNDPCDTTLQSHSHCGVPDPVVDRIAERLVESAWRAKKRLDPAGELRIWFPA
jgi:hypothetical protein